MVSIQTTKYLADYLYKEISLSIPVNYGDGDTSPKKDKEANLCDLFEDFIYMADGGYFLMSESGVIWVYNGKHYEKVTTATFLKELIKRVLKKIGVSKVYEKFTPKFIANECMSGMENNSEGQFAPNRRYIAFQNGIFDVEEGVLKEYSRDYRTDLILDIDYNPEATNQLWEEKLIEIIPNQQMRDAFQLFCGMLLINRKKIKIEYMCYLIGPGSNGKSIIATAVADVFGEQYFAKFAPKQLFKDSSMMFNMAALDGMMANFTDDLDSEAFSGGMYKRFVSGEKFPARHPFGRHVFYVTAPIMLCCTNAMPSTTDDSWGHHRRNLAIYSTTRIREEKDKDPMLQDKLRTKEAREAIFNWIYEGYKRIIAADGKIELGEEVIEAQKELRDDSNSLRRWIRDTGLVKVEERPNGDESWKPLKDWYKMYKDYCFEMGDNHPQNSKSMGRIFKENGYPCKRRGDGMWYCIGRIEDDDAPKETTDPFGNPINRYDSNTPDEELPF